MTDKAFKKDVIGHCYDIDPAEGDEHALGKWLAVGAERMGYDYDPVELHNALMARVKKLGVFKKIAFMGSLVSNTSKAKKAAGLG